MMSVIQMGGRLYKLFGEGESAQYFDIGPAPAPAPAPPPPPPPPPPAVAAPTQSAYEVAASNPSRGSWMTASEVMKLAPTVGGGEGAEYDPYEDVKQDLVQEKYWLQALPALGFTGPVTAPTPTEIEVGESGERRVMVVDGPTPEAKAFIQNLKAQGYDLAVDLGTATNRTTNYGILTPQGQIVAPFSTTDKTFSQAIAPVLGIISLAGGPAALGSMLGATTTTGAAALGNAVINAMSTLISGGDVGDVIKSAVVSGVSPYVAPNIASTLPESGIDALDAALKSGATGAFRSGIGALASGQDPIEAAISGGITGGITGSVGAIGAEYLKDLPEPIQKVVTSAIASEILGGDTERSVVNALLSSVPGYVKEQISVPSTGEEGFFAPGGEGYYAPAPLFPEFEEPLLTAPSSPLEPAFPPFVPEEFFKQEDYAPSPAPFFLEFEEPLLTAPPVLEPAPSPFVPEDFFKQEDYAPATPAPLFPEFEETLLVAPPIEQDFVVDERGTVRDTAGNVGAFAGDQWEVITDPLEFINRGNLEQDFVVDERGTVRDTAGNVGEFVDGEWVARTDPIDFIDLPPAFTAPAPTPAPSPATVAPPATVTPFPAPAPAAQSGGNTAALLAMLASMGFKEDETPAAYQMAQIPVQSPFGLMYGMDRTGPYGMRG